MLQPLQTARDFDARSDEFGQRGALISWAHEQRRTVKWRAGALADEALAAGASRWGSPQARLA